MLSMAARERALAEILRNNGAMDRSPAQAASQRDLVGEVSGILFEADVIGIDLGSNTDEYDPEAEAIVAALPLARDVDDVRSIVHEVFVGFFDAELAGPVERYAPLAATVWAVWLQTDEGPLA